MKYFTYFCMTGLLCLLVTLSSCGRPPGQRLLTVQIELDGKVVYDGIRGVPDSTPVVEMWNVLGDFQFEENATDADVLENTPNNIRTLKGNVVVKISHANDELACASLAELTLLSRGPSGGWTLDEGEVARIKSGAGE
ncbi:MAG: hypothetical protein P8J27_02645 [Mariniblastus sp.]|nr:hypothetical protein [Mariniblastus sp.]